MNYTVPTEAQIRSLPDILQGKDVILQAQTGSGKTLAYTLPLIGKVDPSKASIQAIIIVPTRELSLQVTTVLKQLTSLSPHKYLIMSVMEGSNNRRQQLWAVAEPPQIIVGNPSSIVKLVDTGRLRMNSIRFVVIDEVDNTLLGLESKKDLHRLLTRHLSNTFLDPADFAEETAKVPIKENLVFKDRSKEKREMEAYKRSRQTVLCSATIPQRKYFAELCYRNGWTETVPELINVSEDQLIGDHVSHEVIPCEIAERIQIVSYLLRKELAVRSSTLSNLPEEQQPSELAQYLIFIDYEDNLDYYQKFLQKTLLSSPDSSSTRTSSISISLLTSAMNIEDRKLAMERFRQGRSTILLCSDIASRGIDIPTTQLVIQMSLPLTADQYLHRAGRTGRLGRKGKVITLIQAEEAFVIDRFSNALGISFTQRSLQAKKKD